MQRGALRSGRGGVAARRGAAGGPSRGGHGGRGRQLRGRVRRGTGARQLAGGLHEEGCGSGEPGLHRARRAGVC